MAISGENECFPACEDMSQRLKWYRIRTLATDPRNCQKRKPIERERGRSVSKMGEIETRESLGSEEAPNPLRD
jgi:hypothetical protein